MEVNFSAMLSLPFIIKCLGAVEAVQGAGSHFSHAKCHKMWLIDLMIIQLLCVDMIFVNINTGIISPYK